MDVEPIYCAEQIVVPVDLADVLKAYTKEVIRRQPENLIEFSAKYFQNLATVSSSVQEATAPSQEQLKLLYQRASGISVVTPEQVHALAGQVGVAKSIVSKVLSVGKFSSSVEVDKFVFLLLVMSCESFGAVLKGLFNVFGDTIPADKFQQLIAYLAPDMDPEITTQFLTELGTELFEVPTVTYLSATELSCIRQKL